MTETATTGLEPRYNVQKINDPEGRHSKCRYFVLDPAHDERAVVVMHHYAVLARLQGDLQLALDLLEWLDVRRCRRCACTDEYGCPRGCHWVEIDLCSSCHLPDHHSYVIEGVTEHRDQVTRAIARRNAEGRTGHVHFHREGEPCTAQCTVYAPKPEATP